MHVDALIVGAGPVGLYAAYCAGFRGLTVALMDSLPEVGGQVSAMYPEWSSRPLPGCGSGPDSSWSPAVSARSARGGCRRCAPSRGKTAVHNAAVALDPSASLFPGHSTDAEAARP
jgi:glycine/D-amino acid oxidase-like deaminating enzyme